MKKTAILICGSAALFLSGQEHANAQSTNRYRTPPAAALSADLAAPWLLQLSNKPQAPGYRRVVVAPPPRRTPPRFTMFAPVQVRPMAVQARRPQPAYAAPVPLGTTTRSTAVPARLNMREKQRKEPEFDPQFEMQIVEYVGGEAPGTIIIDTEARFLYLVEARGQARRYGVGVGRPGFEWAGQHKVTRKAEWPDWRPPEEMIAREAARGKIIPPYMEGGPENPLGARALYLGDSLYRIHGTNQPWSIGQAVSSGCIRMRNEDVIDLYERVGVGTKVVVS